MKKIPAADVALLKLHQLMTVGGYSVRSIGNYIREMRFIFEYYPEVEPASLSAEQVEVYICYIKKTFNSGFSKCRVLLQVYLFTLNKYLSDLTTFLQNSIRAEGFSYQM